MMLIIPIAVAANVSSSQIHNPPGCWYTNRGPILRWVIFSPDARMIAYLNCDPSLLCKGQLFRWTFTAWQSDAYQSQIISHIWQSASIFFFFRNIAVLFHFQWFLEMSSSLDHNLTPPPSITFQVDVVVQQTLREKNGHRLYNTCIPPPCHYIFSRKEWTIFYFSLLGKSKSSQIDSHKTQGRFEWGGLKSHSVKSAILGFSGVISL